MSLYREKLSDLETLFVSCVTQACKIYDKRYSGAISKAEEPHVMKCKGWEKLRDATGRYLVEAGTGGKSHIVLDNSLVNSHVYFAPYGEDDVVRFELKTLPRGKVMQVIDTTRSNKRSIGCWVIVERPPELRKCPLWLGVRAKGVDKRLNGYYAVPLTNIFIHAFRG